MYSYVALTAIAHACRCRQCESLLCYLQQQQALSNLYDIHVVRTLFLAVVELLRQNRRHTSTIFTR